jgi:hypothetical protein
LAEINCACPIAILRGGKLAAADSSRAVMDRNNDAIAALLSENVDVNDEGYTAPHGAAFRRTNEVVKPLVQAGARIDVRIEPAGCPKHSLWDTSSSAAASTAARILHARRARSRVLRSIRARNRNF